MLQEDLLQLRAEILPVEASDIRLLWSSEDEECASVDQDGLVTGLAAASSVIIRATSVSSGAYGEIEVTVRQIKDYSK